MTKQSSTNSLGTRRVREAEMENDHIAGTIIKFNEEAIIILTRSEVMRYVEKRDRLKKARKGAYLKIHNKSPARRLIGELLSARHLS